MIARFDFPIADSELIEYCRDSCNPTNQVLTVKARLGNKKVNVTAYLNADPRNGQNDQLKYGLPLAALINKIQNNEQAANIAEFFKPVNGLLSSQQDSDGQDKQSPQIKDLVQKLREKNISSIQYGEFIKEISGNVRSLYPWESCLLAISKLWNKFAGWVKSWFSSQDTPASENVFNTEEQQVSQDAAEDVQGLQNRAAVDEADDPLSDIRQDSIEAGLEKQINGYKTAVKRQFGQNPAFESLFENLCGLSEKMLEALFTHEKAPLCKNNFYEKKLEKLARYLESGDSAYSQIQQFGGSVKSTAVSLLTVSLKALIGFEEGALNAASRKLLQQIFAQDKEIPEELSRFLENKGIDADVIRKVVNLLSNIEGKDFSLQENKVDALQQDAVKNALAEAAVWNIACQAGQAKISLEKIVGQLKEVKKALNNKNPEFFKNITQKTVQLLGRKIALKLAHRLTAGLERVEYNTLLDKTASLTLEHAKQLAPIVGQAKKAVEDGGGMDAQDMARILELNLPEANAQDSEQMFLETIENFITVLMPGDEALKFFKECMEDFYGLLFENLLKDEQLSPAEREQIIKAKNTIAGERTKLFELLSSGFAGQLGNVPGIFKKLIQGYKEAAVLFLRPSIEQFIKDRSLQGIMLKISDPLYLNHLFESKILPLLNMLFVEQCLNYSIAKEDCSYKSDFACLQEENLDEQKLENLAEKILDDLKEMLPYADLNNVEGEARSIGEEVKGGIKDFLRILSEKIKKPDENADSISAFDKIKQILLAQEHTDPSSQELPDNFAYWDFLFALLFGVGGFLEGTWTKTAIEWLRNTIAKQISYIFSELRDPSGQLVVGATADALYDVKEHIGDDVFGDSTNLEARNRITTQNLYRETKLMSGAIKRILLQNLSWYQKQFLPKDLDEKLHESLQEAIKYFFCSDKINKMLLARLFENFGKELAAAMQDLPFSQQPEHTAPA